MQDGDRQNRPEINRKQLDGTKRQSVEVIANDIFFLDNRGEGEGGGGGGWSAQAAPASPGGDLPVDTSDLSSPAPAPAGDDDIPF